MTLSISLLGKKYISGKKDTSMDLGSVAYTISFFSAGELCSNLVIPGVTDPAIMV